MKTHQHHFANSKTTLHALTLALLLVCGCAGRVLAQECKRAVQDPNLTTIEDCGRVIFTHKPIHLLPPASIAPGSGPAFGLVAETERNNDNWQNHFQFNGGVTFNQSYFVGGEAKFSRRLTNPASSSTVRDRLNIRTYFKFWDLTEMKYYGLGPNTKKTDLALFERRDAMLGADVRLPLSGWLAVGGAIESLWPHIEGVRDTQMRSIEKKYTEKTAPGLTTQPHFMRYEVSLQPHYPAKKPYRVDYKVGYNFYHDTKDGRFSFRRFEGDFKHDIRFPLPNSNHLTLRARLATSQTDRGNEVPFYYQETLGGSDINGDYGLRSFNDYRFRARNLMLYTVEYQYEVWKKHGVGIAAFYDAGSVANHARDLSFDNIRHSYGIGFSVSKGDRVYFRVFAAFGGGEGVHPFVGVPKLF